MHTDRHTYIHRIKIIRKIFQTSGDIHKNKFYSEGETNAQLGGTFKMTDK